MGLENISGALTPKDGRDLRYGFDPRVDEEGFSRGAFSVLRRAHPDAWKYPDPEEEAALDEAIAECEARLRAEGLKDM